MNWFLSLLVNGKESKYCNDQIKVKFKKTFTDYQ